MARYYNAETLLEFVKQNTPHIDGETTMKCVERAIKEAPTADVVEVKHGEWIDCIETGTTPAGINISGLVGYKCSLCGRYEGKREPYCNCGAKMRGDTE